MTDPAPSSALTPEVLNIAVQVWRESGDNRTLSLQGRMERVFDAVLPAIRAQALRDHTCWKCHAPRAQP